jgi:hypothetical protein
MISNNTFIIFISTTRVITHIKANNVTLQKDFESFLIFVQISRTKEILSEIMCNL